MNAFSLLINSNNFGGCMPIVLHNEGDTPKGIYVVHLLL